MNYLYLLVSLGLVLFSYALEKHGRRYMDDEGRTPRVRRVFSLSRIILIVAISLVIYVLLSFFLSVV